MGSRDRSTIILEFSPHSIPKTAGIVIICGEEEFGFPVVTVDFYVDRAAA